MIADAVTGQPSEQSVATPPTRESWWHRKMAAPELPVLGVLAASLLAGIVLSPDFWDPSALLYNTSAYVEFGLLALAMTLIIVNGDIDLSVASMVSLCAATIGKLYQAGMPMAVAAVAAVLVGAILGLFNGLIVTLFRLPSLVVTLGTLALYQGLAEVLLTDKAISNYPAWFVGFDQYGVFGTVPDLPMPLLVLLILAAVFWFLLHRTIYGQLCLLTGSNPEAARYSGIRTGLVRTTAFVLCGVMAGLAAVLMTSRLGSTQSNYATGLELIAITVVVLGGTDIFGGRGSMTATLIAFFAVVTVRQAMTVGLVNGQTQNAVIGVLLIGSILVPRLIAARRQAIRHLPDTQTRPPWWRGPSTRASNIRTPAAPS